MKVSKQGSLLGRLQCASVLWIFTFVFLVLRTEAASQAVLKKMPDVPEEVKGMEYVNCWNMQHMEGVIMDYHAVPCLEKI